MQKVIQILATNRDNESIIILSMVNRALRRQINSDAQMWYKMYLQWRGLLQTRTYTKPGVKTVCLVPTMPRTLPNFRPRSLSIR